MTDYPTLTLNDDRQIPQLGFGTYKIDDADAPQAVKTALDVGYVATGAHLAVRTPTFGGRLSAADARAMAAWKSWLASPRR